MAEGFWVRSELLPNGTYGVGISVGEDRAWVLTHNQALAYAAACFAKATEAEHDSAVYGLLTERIRMDAATASAFILQDLLPDRPDQAATEPLRFVAVLGRRRSAPRQRVALLHMLLDGKKVGDLTPADLRSHAGGVLNALAAADLDAGVHRALVKYGLEDHYARAMIDDLGKHWPAPTVPRGGA